MRIAQVVTLISPDASYGGPVRVAINQAQALMRLGHEVTIFAGSSGFASPPSELDGVPVCLFPAHMIIPRSGFAGLSSWRLLRQVMKRAKEFDVIHVHLARDLITMPAALIAIVRRIPLAVQTHGMIDRSHRILAKPLDLVLTRPILRRARLAFHLTPREREGLLAVARGPVRLQSLLNGVPSARGSALVAASQPEVLFLARLHQRKRPASFVEAARAILKEGHTATFALVGPDEGVGDMVRMLTHDSSTITWEGALSSDKTLARMRRASIFVLPSIDEPFPMSVLEAMSVGLPVVVTESCGLAPHVADAGAGIVVDHTQEALTAAMRALIADTALRNEMGTNARQAARERFSIDAIACELERHYVGLLVPARTIGTI